MWTIPGHHLFSSDLLQTHCKLLLWPHFIICCTIFQVSGFPSLKAFRSGKELAAHRHGRDVKTMSEFLAKHALDSELEGMLEEVEEEVKIETQEVKQDAGVDIDLDDDDKVSWVDGSKWGKKKMTKIKLKTIFFKIDILKQRSRGFVGDNIQNNDCFSLYIFLICIMYNIYSQDLHKCATPYTKYSTVPLLYV